MNQGHLEILSLLTTIVAPILALLLALLSTFADTRHEVEVRDKDKVVKKKMLTRHGKILLILMIIAASLTLSGKFVEERQKNIIRTEQFKLDSINQYQRERILNLSKLTLDSIRLSLEQTRLVQQSYATLQETIDDQTLEIQKGNSPLFPLSIWILIEQRFEGMVVPLYELPRYLTGMNEWDIEILENSIDMEDTLGLFIESLESLDQLGGLSMYDLKYSDFGYEHTGFLGLANYLFDQIDMNELNINLFGPVSEQTGKSENFLNFHLSPYTDEMLIGFDVKRLGASKFVLEMIIECSRPTISRNPNNSTNWLDFDNGRLDFYSSSWSKPNTVHFSSGFQEEFSVIIDYEDVKPDTVENNMRYSKEVSLPMNN